MHTLRRTGSIPAVELSASIRDYIVIDVRPTAVWRNGHIPGSANHRPDDLDRTWNDPDPRLPIAVIGDDDTLAATVAHRLRERGRDAVVLEGGYAAWVAAGCCTVRNRTAIR